MYHIMESDCVLSTTVFGLWVDWWLYFEKHLHLDFGQGM